MAKKTKPLASWNDGATKAAIVEFVREVTTESSSNYLSPEERIAVFDNDGTLWCEKPLSIALGFVLARLADMATQDSRLRTVQPWKAAYEHDYAWLDAVLTCNYMRHSGRFDHANDDDGIRVLLTGILRAFGGTTVEEYASSAHAFLQEARHPSLDRPLRGCVYRPMVELVRYLEAHGFATFIATGGDRDFVRSIAWEAFHVPPERLIGSSCALGYREDEQGGTVAYVARPDVLDDGAAKPGRIWSQLKRRPVLAVGNSNGDIQMLQFAGGPTRPALRVLLQHDDDTREFSYTSGAERALELAHEMHWTVVSIKRDWRTIFAKGAA
jgi:phosphoglycolate phosphatase-like HAD superfamily hydrolase